MSMCLIVSLVTNAILLFRMRIFSNPTLTWVDICVCYIVCKQEEKVFDNKIILRLKLT